MLAQPLKLKIWISAALLTITIWEQHHKPHHIDHKSAAVQMQQAVMSGINCDWRLAASSSMYLPICLCTQVGQLRTNQGIHCFLRENLVYTGSLDAQRKISASRRACPILPLRLTDKTRNIRMSGLRSKEMKDVTDIFLSWLKKQETRGFKRTVTTSCLSCPCLLWQLNAPLLRQRLWMPAFYLRLTNM